MPILIKGSGGRKPRLQSKTITPYTSSRDYAPDNGYDGFGEITISACPSPITPTGGNAAVADVRKGKTFYSGGSLLTGTMEDATLPVPTYTTEFQNDNTKLKIAMSYKPTVGYVASTNKVSVTKTLNIPESSMAQSMCEYKHNTGFNLNYDSMNGYYFFDVNATSAKTLKYVFITQAVGSIAYKSGQHRDCLTSVYVDCEAGVAYIAYHPYEDGAQQNVFIDTLTTATSDFYLEDNRLQITARDYKVYSDYDCLAVYQ